MTSFGLIGLAHRKGANDTLDFNGVMTNVDNLGTHSTAFSAHLEGAASNFKFAPTEWAFIVMSYDTTTKTIKYYGNGALKGSKSIGGIIQPGKKFELVTTNSNPGISISQVSFGSLDVNPPFANAGVTPAVWQSPNLITGTVIDDTRLFNKTLSQVRSLIFILMD